MSRRFSSKPRENILCVCTSCGGQSLPELTSYLGTNLCVVERCPNIQLRNFYCGRHVRSIELEADKCVSLRSCFQCKKNSFLVYESGNELYYFSVADNDTLMKLLADARVKAAMDQNTTSTQPVLQIKKISTSKKRPSKSRFSKPKKSPLYHPFGSNPSRSAQPIEICLLSSDSENEPDEKPSNEKITTHQVTDKNPGVPVCKNIDCRNPSVANGFCNTHASRIITPSIPSTYMPLTSPPVSCNIENCSLSAIKDGFCSFHIPLHNTPATLHPNTNRSTELAKTMEPTNVPESLPDSSSTTCQYPKCSSIADIGSKVCKQHATSTIEKPNLSIKITKCQDEKCLGIAMENGYCSRHSNSKNCIAVNCENLAQGENYCTEHEKNSTDQTNVLCKMKNCILTAKYFGYCRHHYMDERCIETGCRSIAKSNGLCKKHILSQKRQTMCTTAFCTRHATATGFCTSHSNISWGSLPHGDGITKIGLHGNIHTQQNPLTSSTESSVPKCKFQDCIRLPKTNGYCRSHFKDLKCQQIECNDIAMENSTYCTIHQVKFVQDPALCKSVNCFLEAMVQGYCRIHFQELKCLVKNCQLIAEVNGKCSIHCIKQQENLQVPTKKMICKRKHCDKNSKTMGFCQQHYNESKSSDEIKSTCAYPSCTFIGDEDGFCLTHAKYQLKHSIDSNERMKVDDVEEKKLNRSCQVDGCILASKTNGFCQKHYNQHIQRSVRPRLDGPAECDCIKHGSCNEHPNGVIKGLSGNIKPTAYCKIVRCYQVALLDGYCIAHQIKQLKKDTTLNSYTNPVDCTIDKSNCIENGCDSNSISNGFCNIHQINNEIQCKFNNCTTRAIGYCRYHENELKEIKNDLTMKDYCKINECNMKSIKNGLCHQHIHSITICGEETCSYHAKKGGYCMAHYIRRFIG